VIRVSVVCLTRNAPRLADACLRSLLACRAVLEMAGDVEFVLIDDCSDDARATLPVLQTFRGAADGAAVTIVRFRRRMHYAAGLAYAFSLARGQSVLFVSQDMVIPPDCVAALFEAAGRDPATGVVRPTSQHMDWARAFAQAPPVPAPTFPEIAAFAADVRRRFDGQADDWPMLIGDAMLVKRSVIERIGVFDPRFYAYLADIDYGVRLRRAGFRHVIARDAWLHHEGAGTARETAAAGGQSFEEERREMLADVARAYAQFRAKWGEANLPPHFRDMKRHDFEALHALPGPLPGDAFVPPLTLSDDIGEVVE
jgi:GT2 family glycosyltransferase